MEAGIRRHRTPCIVATLALLVAAAVGATPAAVPSASLLANPASPFNVIYPKT